MNQFKNFIIYILLVAVVFSLLIGEYIDSLLILAILTANSLIGFFQEISAQRSLESLKKLSAVKAAVIRDGNSAIIGAGELVPGDVIRVEAGDKVPADCRIIDSVRLMVEESSLTGESVPVRKDNKTIGESRQIGDRRNMLFSSTSDIFKDDSDTDTDSDSDPDGGLPVSQNEGVVQNRSFFGKFHLQNRPVFSGSILKDDQASIVDYSVSLSGSVSLSKKKDGPK